MVGVSVCFFSKKGGRWSHRWWGKLAFRSTQLFRQAIGCWACRDMGVSLNGGTPQITHFNRVFHYKPSILGYHFRKPPYTHRPTCSNPSKLSDNRYFCLFPVALPEVSDQFGLLQCCVLIGCIGIGCGSTKQTITRWHSAMESYPQKRSRIKELEGKITQLMQLKLQKVALIHNLKWSK